MVIDEMSREECLEILAKAPVARLGCAAENQPYVVPVYLAYCQSADSDDYLYGFTTMGRKVEWMRANPLVCVEVDQIASRSQWVSVVAFGQFEEIPNVHELDCGRPPERSSLMGRRRSNAPTWEPANEQLLAHKLLEARAMWWEPASTVRADIESADRPNKMSPVFYKIRLTDVTGYRARREEVIDLSLHDTPEAEAPAHAGWLRKAISRWRGDGSRGDAQPCSNCQNSQSADTVRKAR
jgi:uncharacterized protein